MRYRHTHFDNTVNVTKTNPLANFLTYVLSITALIGVLFFLSGWLVEFAISRVDPKMENWLWHQVLSERYVTSKKPTASVAEAQIYLQKLLDRLPKDGLPHAHYDVIVIDSKEVNALALPAGKIVVYSGLLDLVQSENAIVFVLGHELGHFAHRDHLRGFGRRLLVATVLIPLIGNDAGPVLDRIRFGYDMYFSRDQESRADAYGLDALMKMYGHAGGATELFSAMAANETSPAMSEYVSTHPLSQHRIKYLKARIAEQHIPVRSIIIKNISKIHKVKL